MCECWSNETFWVIFFCIEKNHTHWSVAKWGNRGCIAFNQQGQKALLIKSKSLHFFFVKTVTILNLIMRHSYALHIMQSSKQNYFKVPKKTTIWKKKHLEIELFVSWVWDLDNAGNYSISIKMCVLVVVFDSQIFRVCFYLICLHVFLFT